MCQLSLLQILLWHTKSWTTFINLNENWKVKKKANWIRTGADPGLSRGAPTPKGAPTYYLGKIPENCLNTKKIGPRVEARPKFYYVDPPL